MTTSSPFSLLLLGLAIGVLGSYSDDLFGGSAAVAVLQVALWIASAAVLVGAVARATGGRRGLTRGQLHPTV